MNNKAFTIKNALVSVESQTDNEIVIKIKAPEKQVKLGDLVPGTTFKVGKRELIVLGHGKDTTAVILKDFLYTGVFDDDSNNYVNSKVRENLNNGDFRKEIEVVIGAGNLIPHKVILTANDGLKDYGTCVDKVSLMTADNYRRYREFLPGRGDWWWIATPFSTVSNNYSRRVCCVDSDGVVDWDDCRYTYGIRPFCIFSSLISVSLPKEINLRMMKN